MMKYNLKYLDLLTAALITICVSMSSFSAENLSKRDFYKNAAFDYLDKGMSSPPFYLYNIDGIPYVDRDDGTPFVGRNGKRVIHPVLLEQRMLEFHGTGFDKKDISNKYLFKRLINNIIGYKEFNNSSGKIKYEFDFTAGRYGYHFKKGWASAMGQGQMLSLLARTYLDYPDMRPRIRTYAQNVMRPLQVPVNDGGLMYRLRIGNKSYHFYSEYPAKSHAPLTLNGFMFTLIGLREYAYVTGSKTAGRLWNQGIETLLNILPFYDTQPLSTYDLSYITFPNVLANYSVNYHKIHIAQLAYMYKQTGQPLFACVRKSMEKTLSAALAAHDGKLDNFEFRDHYQAPTLLLVCKANFKQPAKIYVEHAFSVE